MNLAHRLKIDYLLARPTIAENCAGVLEDFALHQSTASALSNRRSFVLVVIVGAG